MRLLVRLLAGLLLCGIAGAQSIPFPGPGMPAAAGSAFLHYRTITVDHTKVPTADQTNFPVLFRSFSGTVNTVTTAITLATGDNFPTWMDAIDIAGTTYTFTRINGTTGTTGSSAGTQTGAAYSSTPYLKTMANGGLLADATNGYDAGLYTSSACSTKLDWQRVIWSATTGVAEFHFRVPTLTTGSDYVAYLCYDNSGISTDQSNATGTWNSNYLRVWHFANGVSLSGADATGLGALTTLGSWTATTGQIDGAGIGSGAGGSYMIGSGDPIKGLAAYSVEAWLNPANVGSGNTLAFVSNWTDLDFLFRIDTGGSAALFHFNSMSTLCSTSTAGTVTNSTWVHIVGTYDGTTQRLYKNGTVDANTSSCSGTILNSGTNPLSVGGGATGAENDFTGKIDEVRISNVAHDGNWYATQVNNQGPSASTFFTLGAQN